MSTVPADRIHHRILAPDHARPGVRPLVLLHGLMGFAANWGKIWPSFQSERPVLVLDQRGHGRSEKPAHGYSPEDYAGDLAGLLTHLGWSGCHIVGHSMGGRVALRFCARYPHLAASLCMEDSGVESNPQRIEWIRDLLGAIPTPFPGREEAKAYFASHFREDPLTGSFLHANLETRSDGTLDWRFHAPGMHETVATGRATDASEEFRQLSLPTLVVRGSRSREFPAVEAAHMKEMRPQTRLVEIENAGHYVHAERPAEFSAALSDFLRAVEAGSFRG